MSSHDCFEMGRQSYLNSDYYHTLLWMNEAMDRLNNNTNEPTIVPKADILEYLAFSVFKQGKIDRANGSKKSPKVNLASLYDYCTTQIITFCFLASKVLVPIFAYE